MADYDIFRDQLAIKYPSYGHALWVPSPRKPDRPVQVGDVGFIRRGKFHRLFNALLPADDSSHELGVPEHYEPLVPTLSDHLDTGILGRNNYCSAGVSVEPDPGYNSRPGDFPQVAFQCKRTRGAAVSSLPVAARREDTLARGAFMRWIVKHIDSWLAFARKLELGIEHLEEIILVTGCDRTRSWTNVAFLGNQIDAQVSFGVNVEGANTGINFQFSPENARGAVLHHGPEGTNLPENQCVFIRGYRVTRSFWILPRRLKAAAGPSTDPGGYDCDPDTEVISIPATTKYRDPLHLLLDYIAEQASDCDLALAHDEDLVTIGGLGHDTSPETIEPDVMMDLLRRSNIEIHKVLCDLSPTDNDSNSNTSVKVAMLSTTFQNWNIGSQSRWTPFATQNLDFNYISEFPGTCLPAMPGSLQVPPIQGDISKRENSLLADHGDSTPSAPQDSIDDIRGLGHAAKDILLALSRVRILLSNIWSRPSIHAYTERDSLLIAVVIICCAVLGWVFPFTRVIIFRLFFTFLATFPLSVWLQREYYTYRRGLDGIIEKLEALQHHVMSLQLNPVVPVVVADVRNSLPIIARATPANLDMLGQSGMQAISREHTNDRTSFLPKEDAASLEKHIRTLERELEDARRKADRVRREAEASWVSERARWEQERQELVERAKDQIADAADGLRDLVQRFDVPLFSRESDLGELADALRRYLEKHNAHLSEKLLVAEVEKRNAMARELEGARAAIQALQAYSSSMGNSSSPYMELGPSSPVTFAKDAAGIVAILQPLWENLPSPEARAARLSSAAQVADAGGSGPSSPSSPTKDNMGPGVFSVEAFAQRVEALISDDRALVERLVRFMQEFDLLKKNTQKVAHESHAVMEAYQRQLRTLEERLARSDGSKEQVEQLTGPAGEKLAMGQHAAEQADTLRELTDANAALSARALQLAQDAAAAQDELQAVRSSSEREQGQRLALLEEINLVQTENGSLRQQLHALGKL